MKQKPTDKLLICLHFVLIIKLKVYMPKQTKTAFPVS